jgi:hypothetical protein
MGEKKARNDGMRKGNVSNTGSEGFMIHRLATGIRLPKTTIPDKTCNESVPYNKAAKKNNNTKTEDGESDSFLVLLKGKHDEETGSCTVATLFDVPTNKHYYTTCV